jgi:hypothetical protein
VAEVLPRYLGAVEDLPTGMWCVPARDFDGEVAVAAIRCPGCTSVIVLDQVDGDVVTQVGPSGVITPELVCPFACSWRAWIVLESFQCD